MALDQRIKDVVWVSETTSPVRGVILALQGLGGPVVLERPASAPGPYYVPGRATGDR